MAAAAAGYGLASGAGIVNALLFVPELAVTASHPNWSWARIMAAASTG